MVKKLFKHEFKYYFKSYIIFLPFLIVISLFIRLLDLFPDKYWFVEMTKSLAYAALALGWVVCFLLALILSLVRYYKNLFTQEGYLTFTLPVTNQQLLFVKVVTSLTCLALSIVTIIISALIAFATVYDISNFFTVLHDTFFSDNVFVGILSLILFIIAFIIVGIYYILLYFGCITVGQTSRKNRIMMAIGVYFVYYFATQVLSLILIFILGILSEFGLFGFLGPILYANPVNILIIIPTTIIIIYGGLSTAFYFIIMKILNNKLNLE